MKKMNFEQMENLQGGQTQMVDISVVDIDEAKIKCLTEGLWLAASVVAWGGTLATPGAGWVLIGGTTLGVLAAQSGFHDCVTKK
jgi:hypothetical protein